MGNPLLKNYNIEKEHYLTGGFNNLWKIFKGSRKDRKQDVSVFVLEKKLLEKYPKEEREEILNVLKKEASVLIKFKHPSILGIYEQLSEDKQSMIFVAEPFLHTLSSWIESGGLSKLEIKLMITELCHVLGFLHDDAHVIHTAINLDNVFINSQGHIKLSGLGFSVNDPSVVGIEYKLNPTFPDALPCLKFVAPEIIYENKTNYQSDIFSVGMIVYNLLKFHKGEHDRDLININSNTIEAYKKSMDALENKLMHLSFEEDDNDMIYKALNKNIQSRPVVKEILEHTWFNDPKLKALRFVENLEQNDVSKNTEFLAKFPQILHFFENKIVERKFLPAFMNALKVESLIVSTLPAIFCICESSNYKIDFEQLLWPGLKTLFQMKQIPAAALYFLLSKLSFIAEKISNSEFASNMLNIICKALDCGVAKIQNVILDNLLFIIKKVDSLAFKNQIYPRLVNIVLNANSTSHLKISILKSFISVYSLLDQNTINESLLNTLEKIRKLDNNAEICMCVVKIYEEIAKVVSVESIANKILPNLISILISGNISKSNFENIMNLVQKYLSRIKDSREKDLSDDNTNKFDKDINSTGLINSTKIAEKDDFSFLNSFFGNNPSISSATMTKIPDNTVNNNDNNNKNLDFDFINKGLDETVKKTGGPPTHIMKQEPKKEKTIFDGIKDNSVSINNKNNPINNLNQFNSSSSINKNNILSANTINTKTNDLEKLGFNFSNDNLNNKPNSSFKKTEVNSKNNFPSIDFSKTSSQNNKKNSNILDSLLMDLPSSTTTANNNLNSKNSIVNKNVWDVNFNNEIKQNNNFNLDENNLDFLKNKSGNIGIPAQTNSNNNFNFNFNSPNNGATSKNTNDPNKNLFNGLLDF